MKDGNRGACQIRAAFPERTCLKNARAAKATLIAFGVRSDKVPARANLKLVTGPLCQESWNWRLRTCRSLLQVGIDGQHRSLAATSKEVIELSSVQCSTQGSL